MSMVTTGTESETEWGTGPITPAQAAAFAARVTSAKDDQATIARNLASFPPTWTVRGVFFEGLSRIVAQARSEQAMAELLRKANLPLRTTAFRHYPQRDFYKLYYLAARLLHPSLPLSASLRRVSQTFFPIFRSSILGKTMSALMGDKPRTILPLMARAYNLSTEGNQHEAELTGPREVTWRCLAESIDWYVDTFTGILEGAMPPDAEAPLRISVKEKVVSGGAARYLFVVSF